MRAMDARLVASQPDRWYVPAWHDISRLAFDVPAGATAITCDTDGREWRAGGWGVLLDDEGNSEAFAVDAVASGGVTADSGLSQDWSAGTPIYPANLGVLPASVDLGQITAGVRQTSVNFELVDQPTPPSSHDLRTYDDGTGALPLWEHRPNWISPADQEHQRFIERFDAQIGGFQRFDRAGVSFFLQTHDHLFRTREERNELRDWLLYVRGRYRTFWVPTWLADLEATAELDGVDPFLFVRPVAWSLYEGQLGRRDLYIQTLDEDTAVGINDSMFVGDDERFTLDATPPAATVEQIRKISWLQKARLARDSFEIAYRSATVGNVTATVRSTRA